MPSLVQAFRSLFKPAPSKGRRTRRRILKDPDLIYAVGDVHGCFELLQRLENEIVQDASRFGGEKWIVMLGDYVDRGPQSAQVIDHLMSPPPPGFSRISLAGNHEDIMAEFMAAPSPKSDWLQFGGKETLLSYGIPESRLQSPSTRNFKSLIESHVPEEHVAFVSELPVLLETPSFIFVHAGLAPGLSIEEQDDGTMMWFRDGLAESYRSVGKTVVHGHVASEKPHMSDHRIVVDTGAYLTGILSAIRLSSDGGRALLQVAQRK